MSNPDCDFEAGQRDRATASHTPSASQSRPPTGLPSKINERVLSFSGRGLDRVRDILDRATTGDRVMPPTELFNEGWLLRLALDWFAGNAGVEHALSVPVGTRWYSEALLPTQFAARKRGDSLSESHTHADGAVGHFEIGKAGAGDLALKPDASHFVILEAKLNSKLSSGVKNATGFDQAARNVACMAHVLSSTGVRPEQLSRLGFFVVAPASQIERNVFATELTKESIRLKVERRVAAYASESQTRWFTEWFLPVLDTMAIGAVSWEDVAVTIAANDKGTEPWFAEFYDCCLHYNRLG